MENNKQPEQINRETAEKHTKQYYLQILLPILAGTLVFIVLGALAASGGTDRPAVWAHISTIFIAIIIGTSGIFSLLFLIFSIYGTNWLIKKLPAKSYLVYIYTVYFGHMLNTLENKLTHPVISTKTGLAGISALFQGRRKSK